MDDIGYNLILDDSGFKVTAAATSAQLKAMEAQFASTGQAVAAIESKINSAGVSFHQWTTAIGAVKFAMMDLQDIFLSFPEAVLETTGQIEKLGVMLEGLSTQGTDAGRALDAAMGTKFILNMEQNVPFALTALTNTFVKLKAGGIDPMSGSMSALVGEVAKFGGSSEQLTSATLAIQQMAGKGSVSLQELRQQLSQAIPGAAKAMAAGMDMSMGDLVKAITKGTVGSGTAIQKMLAVFNIDSLGAASAQMETWAGSLEKLNTRWDLFKLDVGKNGMFDEAKAELNQLIGMFDAPEAKVWSAEIGQGLTGVLQSLNTAKNGFIEFGSEIETAGKILLAYFATTTLASWISGAKNALSGVVDSYREYTANAIAAEGAVVAETLSATELILQADAERVASSRASVQAEIDGITERIAANDAAIRSEEAGIAAGAASRQADVLAQLADNETMLNAKKASLAEMLAAQTQYQATLVELQAITENPALPARNARVAGEIADLESRITYMKEATSVAQTEVTGMSIRSNALRSMAEEEIAVTGTINDRIVAIAASSEAMRAEAALQAESIAAMTEMTTGAARLEAGIGALGFAFNALGGWITVISGLILAGVYLWKQWGDAAAEAAKVAVASQTLVDAAQRGTANQAQVAQSQTQIAEQQKTIAELKQQIATEQQGHTVGGGGDSAPVQIAPNQQIITQLQTQLGLEQSKLKTMQSQLTVGQAQVAQNQAIVDASQFKKPYTDATETDLSGVQKRASAAKAAREQAFQDRTAGMKTDSAEYLALQKQNTEAMHAEAIAATQDEIKTLTDRRNQINAIILKGFAKTPQGDAQGVAAANAQKDVEQTLTSAQGFLTSLNAPNDMLAGKTAGASHPPTDFLSKALGKAQEQLDTAMATLKQINEGATQYDQLRAQTQAKVQDMIDSGQLDFVTHGKGGSKTKPDIDDPKVQTLIDDQTLTEIVKNTTAQVTQIEQKLAPIKQQLQQSTDLMLTGDFTSKPGTQENSVLDMLDKMKVKGLIAANQFADLATKIKAAALPPAQLDLVNYTRTQMSGDAVDQAKLINDKTAQAEALYQIAATEQAKEDQMHLDAVTKLGGDVAAEQALLQQRALTRYELHLKDMETPMQKLADSWQDTTTQMQSASTGWANDTISAFTTLATTGKLSFTSLITAISNDMVKVSMQKLLGPSLQTGFDGLANGFANLLNGLTNPTANPGTTPAVGAGAGLDTSSLLASSTEALGQQFVKLASTSDNFGFSMGDSVKNLITGDTAQMATTNGLTVLANAALQAAAALASLGGGSGSASGIGGLFASLLGGGSGAGGTDASYGAGLSSSDSMTAAVNGLSFSGAAFANGGIMTQFGPMALRKYANGGIANSPQAAIFGEGSTNEAFVPLPDGKSIPVTLAGPAGNGGQSGGSGQPNVTVNVINQTSNAVTSSQSSPRFDGNQMVLDVVLSAATTPGSFRDNMRGAMK